jgi:ABC-type amino acid transport substrate-binding protein
MDNGLEGDSMRKTRLGALIAILAMLAVPLLAAGCGGDNDNGGGGVPKQITVGSDIPYPPFEFGKSPPYQGYDIDIVNEIAKRIGTKVTYQDTSFDTIFRDLAQGKFDMVASSTTITPERQKEVDFSQGYYETDQSLTVKQGSDIKSVEDLQGRTVGAQKATTGADYAQSNTSAASVRTYGEVDDAFNALEAGQVDAVINDFSSSEDAVNSKGGLEIVQKIVTRKLCGLAFQKGSTDLEDAVNGALTDMKKDGTYTKIYEKWFKEKPPASLLKTGSTS